MKLPLMVWLLQGIPECIAIASIVVSLCIGQLRWKLILKIGLVQSVILYIVRALPIVFGVHTVILMISLGIVSTWLAKIELKKAVLCSNLAFIILVFFESIILHILTHLGITNVGIIYDSSFIRVLVGLPQVILLVFMAIVIGNNEKCIKYVKEKGLRQFLSNRVL